MVRMVLCPQQPWQPQELFPKPLEAPGECAAHLPAQEPPSPRSCLPFPGSETVAPKQEHELAVGTLLQVCGWGVPGSSPPKLTILIAGSLSAFVYQHAITPLALPCKLSIPTRGRRWGRREDPRAPPAAPGGWARSWRGEGSEPPSGACEGLLPWLQVELTWGREGGGSFALGAREVGVGEQR